MTPTDNLEAGVGHWSDPKTFEENPVEAGAGDLVELLDGYWDLAYAEGKEGRSHDTEGGDAQRVRSAIAARIQELTAERDAAEDAENQAKDCFWAIYHDWVDLKGHGLSTEAARTMLAERAVTAEACVKALLDLIESNGSGSMIRAARAVLSQEAPK